MIRVFKQLMLFAAIALIAAASVHAGEKAPVLNAAAQAAVQPDDEGEAEFGVLVVETGVEETFIYCAACHSERIVAQQGLTRDGWIGLLEWMVDEQEMDVIEEPDYTLIVDYLARNYGGDRPNFPRN